MEEKEPAQSLPTLDYAGPLARAGITIERKGGSLEICIPLPRKHMLKVWMNLFRLLWGLVVLGFGVFLTCRFNQSLPVAFIVVGLLVEILLLYRFVYLGKKRRISISSTSVRISGCQQSTQPDNDAGKGESTLDRKLIYEVKYSTVSNLLMFRATGHDIVEMNIFYGEIVGRLLAEEIRKQLGLNSGSEN